MLLEPNQLFLFFPPPPPAPPPPPSPLLFSPPPPSPPGTCSNLTPLYHLSMSYSATAVGSKAALRV